MKKSLSKNDRPIFLYYPEYDLTVTRSNLLELPLPLLHVAGALMQEGFEVRLVDGRLPDAHAQLKELDEEPLFFGISLFLGQIKDGYAAAKIIKTRFPKVPVVAGGWLPTQFPEILKGNTCFDMFVRGPAEHSTPELARNIQEGKDPFSVPGVIEPNTSYTNSSQNRISPVGVPNLDIPYHLLDMEKYELKAGRTDMLTSRGCPLRCTFCAMASIYKGKWFGRSGDEIVEALADLKTRYALQRVQFYDDTFFFDKSRVLTMAQGLLDRGIDIKWMGTANPKELGAFDEKEWKLLVKSGCSIVSSGVESGSARIRRSLGKNVTNEEIIQLATRLQKSNVRFAPFFMVGAPNESSEEMAATFSLASQLLRIDPANYPYISMFQYIPLPNTPIFDRTKENGRSVVFPATIDELCSIRPESHWGQAPWIPRAPLVKGHGNRKSVIKRAFYFWAGNLCPSLLLPRKNQFTEFFRKRLLALINKRIDKQSFALPLEWYAYRISWQIKRLILKVTASESWRRSNADRFPQGRNTS